MSPSTALLTFSIGPVHGFIVQARRVADLWAGSGLLSHLTGEAVKEAWRQGGDMIFPYLAKDAEIPAGFPNRFVCRVPLTSDGDVTVAGKMEAAVRNEWNGLVAKTVGELRKHKIEPDDWIWNESAPSGQRQTDHLLEVAWSWVPEDGSYAEASQEGARRFALSRLFRPFSQIHECGEKCAICGERNALPDGKRDRVRDAWSEAAKESEGQKDDEPYLRRGQTRLCLVCATKRFYPKWHKRAGRFADFHDFEPPKPPKTPGERVPAPPEESEKFPYFAIVSMDGDRMGEVLGWPEDKIVDGKIEKFHERLSRALLEFADGLRTQGSAQLNLKAPDAQRAPQLIYAGGEDVLFVCDPRSALKLAWQVRSRYLEALRPLRSLLKDPEDVKRLTISAGILFAHTKHPAGLLFRDVEELLKRKAKGEADRDAVAIRLAKRGGVPVEVAFKWDEAAGEDRKTWVDRFDVLLGKVATKEVSSGQTFNLRRDERVLFEAFTEEAQWVAWLGDRLSRRETGADPAGTARLLAPFFVHRKTDALRILRFLAREVR